MLYLRKPCETWSLLCCLFAALHLGGIYGAEEKTVPAVKENTLSGDSKQAIDYDYNDEEDNSSGGGSHSDGKMLHAKSTVMPYFEHNITTVYLKPDQDNLQLKCHPKNFDEKHHLILWYKDGHAITNGNITLSNEYELDNNYSLTILNYQKKALPNNLGNFSCEILPHLIRQYIVIRTGTEAPDNILEKLNEASSSANNLSAMLFQKYYHFVLMLSILNVGLSFLNVRSTL